MSTLFIDTWWGSYIGGSDDSLLLLDYFRDKETEHFNLAEVCTELHLDVLMHADRFEEGDVYYNINGVNVYHFDLASSVLADLATLVLQGLKSDAIPLQSLSKSAHDTKVFTLKSSPEQVKKIKDSLAYFIANTDLFEITNFMTKDELHDLVTEYKEVASELANYTS